MERKVSLSQTRINLVRIIVVEYSIIRILNILNETEKFKDSDERDVRIRIRK